MEPLTAIGLVTNIFQLIDVATTLASTAKAIRKSSSGFSANVDNLRSLATDVGQALDAADIGEDRTKAFLQSLNQYMVEIEVLRVQHPQGLFQSCIGAVRTWYNKDKLEESRRAMGDMGASITMHLITTHIPAINTKLDDLSDQSKHTRMVLLDKMTELRTQLQTTSLPASNIIQSIQAAIQESFNRKEEHENQRRFLDALDFDQLQKRENEIHKAHAKTFQWIFGGIGQGQTKPHETRFRDWLHATTDDKNVFWISGKPGAGKSTLMKYLAHEQALEDHLSQWTCNQKLIVAKYYFWKHGSHLQKSLVGMVRALLFQCLSQHPDLFTQAFPNKDWLNAHHSLSFHRVQEMLKSISAAAPQLNIKLFFLIDGLDELDDRDDLNNIVTNERDLIAFLQNFKAMPSVKLCVSSRALNTFQNAFGQINEQCLKIHDLTRNDIRAFIHDIWEGEKNISNSVQSHLDYKLIVEELIEAAEGVFLWVKLASRILLDGMTNQDRISNLREKLRSIPGELYQVYEFIWETIDDNHQPKAAYILSSVLRYPGEIPTLVWGFEDDEELSRFLARKSLTAEEVSATDRTIAVRTNAYCRGLVDYIPPPVVVGKSSDEFLYYSGLMNMGPHRTMLQQCLKGTLQFAHRTVGDWFQAKPMHTSLLARETPSPSSSDARLAQGYLGSIWAQALLCMETHSDTMATIQNTGGREVPYFLLGLRGQCVFFFKLLDAVSTEVAQSLLVRWVQVVSQVLPKLGSSTMDMFIMAVSGRGFLPLRTNIVGFAILCCCPARFIEGLLTINPLLLHAEEEMLPPIFVATMCPGPSVEQWMSIKWGVSNHTLSQTIEVLLESGADPNVSLHGSSPWTTFLIDAFYTWQLNSKQVSKQGNRWYHTTKSTQASEFPEPGTTSSVVQRIELFLRFGADLNASCNLVAFCSPTYLRFRNPLWYSSNTISPPYSTFHRSVQQYAWHARMLSFSAGSLVRQLCGDEIVTKEDFVLGLDTYPLPGAIISETVEDLFNDFDAGLDFDRDKFLSDHGLRNILEHC
jgi:hypothetical protein